MNAHPASEIMLQPPMMLRREFVRELSPQTVRAFERIRARYHLSAGEMLFTRGDSATRLFEIASGTVRLWLDRPHDQELALRIARSGEILGLREVVTGGKYGINATAASAVEVFSFPRKGFIEVLHRHFDAGFSATRMLSTELTIAHETLRSMVATSGAALRRGRDLEL